MIKYHGVNLIYFMLHHIPKPSFVNVGHSTRSITIRWCLIEYFNGLLMLIFSCPKLGLFFYFLLGYTKDLMDYWCWYFLVLYLINLLLCVITIDSNFFVIILRVTYVDWYTHLFSSYIVIIISFFLFLKVFTYISFFEIVIDFSFLCM